MPGTVEGGLKTTETNKKRYGANNIDSINPEVKVR